MDVIFATRQIVEKGMDEHGLMAVGAADIERFYDGICPIKCAEFLVRMGMDEGTAFTFARLHLASQVKFELRGRLFLFNSRAGAVLTGTRTSIIAGRIVIYDVAHECAPTFARLGLRLPGQT